jgi:hypothetical protein
MSSTLRALRVLRGLNPKYEIKHHEFTFLNHGATRYARCTENTEGLFWAEIQLGNKKRSHT